MTVPMADPVIPPFGGGDDSCITSNGLFCTVWFKDHWGSIFAPALLQHIQLTAIAIGIGFVIAGLFALLAYRLHWLEMPFVGVASVLYTIPSLALFQLLVPITGLSITTAEIALTSYTLLIIFRNILIGLREVPPEVVAAATAMGYTPTQVLFKIQLRIALPAIIAGLRIATVTVISLSTIAAFVVNMGLGAVIFDALQSPFNTKFIAAGVLAVGLALVADLLLVGVQRLLSPWMRKVQVSRL
jgi:osmoprotectant transport system permease protein